MMNVFLFPVGRLRRWLFGHRYDRPLHCPFGNRQVAGSQRGEGCRIYDPTRARHARPQAGSVKVRPSLQQTNEHDNDT